MSKFSDVQLIDKKLLKIVSKDIRQNKFLFILALAAFLASLTVIYNAHLYRSQVILLDTTMSQRDALNIEWRNLLLEEQAQAEHGRVTSVAQKDLDMHRPQPEAEVVVRAP